MAYSNNLVASAGAFAFQVAAGTPYYFCVNNFQFYPDYTLGFNDPTTFGLTAIATATAGDSPKASPQIVQGSDNDPTIMTALGNPSLGLLVASLAHATAHATFSPWTRQNTLASQTSRWNWLWDLYFYDSPVGTPDPTQTVNLLIQPYWSDQMVNVGGVGVPFYKLLWTTFQKSFQKTISGQLYQVIIDADDFASEHTVHMFIPNQNGSIMGITDATIDIAGIVQWLASANPLDDAGLPVVNSSNVPVGGHIIRPETYFNSYRLVNEMNFYQAGDTVGVTNHSFSFGGQPDAGLTRHTKLVLTTLPTTRDDGTQINPASVGGANIYKNDLLYATIPAPLKIGSSWTDPVAQVQGDTYQISIQDTQAPSILGDKSVTYTVPVTSNAPLAAPGIIGGEILP